MSDIQIIVPMSGFGERFRAVGYNVPKPLIEVENKPIIYHIIKMFPGETNFIFICNNEHLNNTKFNMEKILQEYCHSGKIVGINPHKLGPVHAILQVKDLIDYTKPVIVNYCDFTCFWDWQRFKEFVFVTKCSGAIPAYKDFHPHSLGKTNYAYIVEENGWVKNIQEKQPFTDNRMNEYASSGTYYFSSGDIMLKAMENCVKQGLTINKEYYVSLAYKYLLSKNLPTAVYPLQHFMQWGTPADLKDYIEWSTIFKKLSANYLIKDAESFKPKGTTIIPMAGLGERFAKEGYKMTKPLIPVSGKPMVLQAIYDLPKAHHYVFILRKDMPNFRELTNELKNQYPNSEIIIIEELTEGQAITAKIGLDYIEEKLGETPLPITFAACDSGMIYNIKKFFDLVDNPDIDIIVWGARNHSKGVRNPEMFGWIDSDKDGKIRKISVKKALKDPRNDPIITGTFTFCNPNLFHKSLNSLISKNGKINGEFYLDSCIQEAISLGMHCHLFEIEHWLSWGTPDDLRTFQYWQSCFHKWEYHPSRLELDKHIPQNQIKSLKDQYKKIIPIIPEKIVK